jgi:nitrite reductase/ring-hydroxylating ferredoxin subunit
MLITRLVDALVNAQAGWADPFGRLMQAIFRTILKPVPPLRDFLHGTWLGHPLHPLLTDVPVGAFTVALVLDVLGLRDAAAPVIAFGVLAMLGTMVAGYVDYIDIDVDGPPRRYGSVHQTLMLLSLICYFVSGGMRYGQFGGPGAIEVPLAVVGYVLLAVGAYLGGDLVFRMGMQVDRHAWRDAGDKWRALDITEVPADTPTKAKAGGQTLVVVRRGDTLFALHDTCAHQGCSLSEGRLVDDGRRIECGCHRSRFELVDGSLNRGPAVYRQPAYEVRQSGGKIEVRART